MLTLIKQLWAALVRMLGGWKRSPNIKEPDPVGLDFMPEAKVSDFPVYRMAWSKVLTYLDRLGLSPMIDRNSGIPDAEFFYTDEKSWEQIIKTLTYPADFYVDQERKDCDDYSKKASADSSFYYGLNCLQVWGDSPEGYHAFNLVQVGED